MSARTTQIFRFVLVFVAVTLATINIVVGGNFLIGTACFIAAYVASGDHPW